MVLGWGFFSRVPVHDTTAFPTDPFTGHPTRLHGPVRDGDRLRERLCHDLGRGLAAFTGLRRAAQAGGLGGIEESALLAGLAEIRRKGRSPAAQIESDEGVGADASADPRTGLKKAVERFQREVRLISLADLGFDGRSPNPLEEANLWLRRIGGGVEAWAFADVSSPGGWIYKFFMPRPEGGIGATFRLERTASGEGWAARSAPGSYADVVRKLILINALGGMATELCGITPEGVVVVKQAPGRVFAEDTPTSGMLPASLIPFPSRFLTADRDHPRLFFLGEEPWLVADTHSKNVVLDPEGVPRVIDLVAAPLSELERTDAMLGAWLRRVRLNPRAGVLAEAADEEY